MCCVAISLPISQAASSAKASQRRWTGGLPCAPYPSPPTGRNVALSAGLGEKPSSQLVYGPGPLVSGFPVLRNLSIRAINLSFLPLWRL